VLNDHSAIPGFLESKKLTQKFIYDTPLWKDSRDITDDDRKMLLKIIEKDSSQKIIITHGTYTLAETARFLKEHLSKIKQTIIFTGSLIPLVGYKNSDAPENLLYALEQISSLPWGVYVCMNKKTFLAEEAAKDLKTGQFYLAFKNKY